MQKAGDRHFLQLLLGIFCNFTSRITCLYFCEYVCMCVCMCFMCVINIAVVGHMPHFESLVFRIATTFS